MIDGRLALTGQARCNPEYPTMRIERRESLMEWYGKVHLALAAVVLGAILEMSGGADREDGSVRRAVILFGISLPFNILFHVFISGYNGGADNA
jgi:hypothetical protein